MQAALRGVLESAYDLDLMGESDYRKAVIALKTVQGETIPAGREIAGEKCWRWYRCVKSTPRQRARGMLPLSPRAVRGRVTPFRTCGAGLWQCG